jgi:uncharacterized protein (TIGR02996 family)
MTGDGEALLRAICERPWEVDPRLVYADWLEENGQPERAEFIRLQLEVAALPRNQWSDAPQRVRADALESKWDPHPGARTHIAMPAGKPWAAELPAGKGVEWSH